MSRAMPRESPDSAEPTRKILRLVSRTCRLLRITATAREGVIHIPDASGRDTHGADGTTEAVGELTVSDAARGELGPAGRTAARR
jgi:hypothetical protein